MEVDLYATTLYSVPLEKGALDAGPVLIRGGRLDGQGRVAFEEPIAFPDADFLTAGDAPPESPSTIVKVCDDALPF